MIKKRAGWLSALFIGEMLTATVLGVYQKEIDRQTLLALFLPLIISSGGNSGSQGTSLLIRALALREVSLRDWWRVAGRELATGVTLGSSSPSSASSASSSGSGSTGSWLRIIGQNYDVTLVNGAQRARRRAASPARTDRLASRCLAS